MAFRKKNNTTTERRRPHLEEGNRAQNYSYYARPPAADNNTARARREPLPRSKKEIMRYLGQRFGLVIAAFAVLALLISSIQVSMQPRLVLVNESEVYRLHPDATYEDKVVESLRSSWTNTNKITINTLTIASELKQAYPEVADASVALPVLGQRPVVYVQLTKPSLLLVSNDGQARVLDEKGRVLAPANQVSNLDSFKLPVVTDESGIASKPGKLALSSDSVQFILSVLYELKAASVSYSRLVLPAASQQLDVYISGQPYFVKFNMYDSETARQQTGAYLATIAYLRQQGKVPGSYVDVRLVGRAYYR